MMEINCKKMRLLVGGLAIFGGAGFSACCFAQDVKVQAPIQRVCESAFGPASPLFADVKQIYLLWHFNAEQPELLAEPLREEALKKEVLAYMQTYLTPCSKSKEIKVMDWDDDKIIQSSSNLIVYTFWRQYAETKKGGDGKHQTAYQNGVTFKGGFYRAGSYMTSGDVASIANSSTKVEGELDGLESRISSSIRAWLGIKGRPHNVIK